MIIYYQEIESGDYLAIDTSSNAYYRKNGLGDCFEGRATCITQNVGSVCTTGVGREFLREKCKRIAKKNVPAAWRDAIGL